MELNKEKLAEYTKSALKVIKQYNLIFIDEVATYMGISRTTFYHYELNKNDTIGQALIDNKVSIKNKLRHKWSIDGNATTQIVLYRLCGTKEETDILNSREDITKQEPQKIIVEIVDGSQPDES